MREKASLPLFLLILVIDANPTRACTLRSIVYYALIEITEVARTYFTDELGRDLRFAFLL